MRIWHTGSSNSHGRKRTPGNTARGADVCFEFSVKQQSDPSRRASHCKKVQGLYSRRAAPYCKAVRMNALAHGRSRLTQSGNDSRVLCSTPANHGNSQKYCCPSNLAALHLSACRLHTLVPSQCTARASLDAAVWGQGSARPRFVVQVCSDKNKNRVERRGSRPSHTAGTSTLSFIRLKAGAASCGAAFRVPQMAFDNSVVDVQ